MEVTPKRLGHGVCAERPYLNYETLRLFNGYRVRAAPWLRSSWHRRSIILSHGSSGSEHGPPASIVPSGRNGHRFRSSRASVPTRAPRQLGKFEAQKLCIPFDASEFQEPDGRIGKYSFKLEIVIGSRKSVKHELVTQTSLSIRGFAFSPVYVASTRPLPLRIACPAFLAYVSSHP